MAHYLVSAVPRTDRLDELRARLTRDEFRELQPFGRALTKSLRDARIREDGLAVWEEEDYCRPPLAEERAAVLDTCRDRLPRTGRFRSGRLSAPVKSQSRAASHPRMPLRTRRW